MLQLGSRGDAVKALQRKLGITADGIFGPQTLAAVKAYQSRNGLAVDGIVGPKTSAKLGLSSGTSTKATATTAARPVVAPDWSKTDEGRAAMFGWSKAVIDSNPELKKLFAQASKENWTADHFVAKVRDTKWFKTHSDTFRQAAILQKADPATYNQRVAQSRSQINAIAAQVGAYIPASIMATISAQAVQFGWTTDQIKQTIAKYVTPQASGAFTGDAGAYQMQYNQLVAQYGANVSTATIAKWVQDSVLGKTTPEVVKKYLTGLTASRFPALAERLAQGETLQQIAEPYVQSYAQTLELNPNAIKLSDAAIQQALAAKDAQGKPTAKTVWQFEQDLRQDPRYMKTQQAQDTAMKMTRQVLSDWGIVG